MKHYKNSDYAINKFASGIIYRFADQIVKVTLSDYLTENPDKTEDDFLALKRFSDHDYLEQARKDNATTRKDISLSELSETLASDSISMDEQYIEKQDMRYSKQALKQLLHSGQLTAVQERRLRMLILSGLSRREIAAHEGVHKKSVDESITAAVEKLRRNFRKF